jgi:hypothetical protein
MTSAIDDILRAFSELGGSQAEKLEWLHQRLERFSEELAQQIEGKLVGEPTFIGRHYNEALKEAAAIIRKAIGRQ